MKIKNALPATRSTPENKQSNNNKLHLSPTERRIIKLLFVKPRISYDLEEMAYCRYAADNIQHLRQKGIKIITEMVPYKRQIDGKIVTVGRYRIASESMDKAYLASLS